MIFGACHHSLSEIMRALEKASPTSVPCQIVDADTLLASRPLYYIMGVSALSKHTVALSATTSVVIVLDTFYNLLKVKGISLLDCEVAAQDVYHWRPDKIAINKVKKALSRKRGTLKIEFTPVDYMKTLLVQVREKGILDKVLTYLYKIPNKQVRASLQQQLYKYFLGNLSLATVSSRLKPKREGTSLYQSYIDLVNVLDTEQCHTLIKVLKLVTKRKDVNLEDLCREYNTDLFEVTYILKSSLTAYTDTNLKLP